MFTICDTDHDNDSAAFVFCEPSSDCNDKVRLLVAKLIYHFLNLTIKENKIPLSLQYLTNKYPYHAAGHIEQWGYIGNRVLKQLDNMIMACEMRHQSTGNKPDEELFQLTCDMVENVDTRSMEDNAILFHQILTISNPIDREIFFSFMRMLASLGHDWDKIMVIIVMGVILSCLRTPTGNTIALDILEWIIELITFDLWSIIESNGGFEEFKTHLRKKSRLNCFVPATHTTTVFAGSVAVLGVITMAVIFMTQK